MKTFFFIIFLFSFSYKNAFANNLDVIIYVKESILQKKVDGSYYINTNNNKDLYLYNCLFNTPVFKNDFKNLSLDNKPRTLNEIYEANGVKDISLLLRKQIENYLDENFKIKTSLVTHCKEETYGSINKDQEYETVKRYAISRINHIIIIPQGINFENLYYYKNPGDWQTNQPMYAVYKDLLREYVPIAKINIDDLKKNLVEQKIIETNKIDNKELLKSLVSDNNKNYISSIIIELGNYTGEVNLFREGRINYSSTQKYCIIESSDRNANAKNGYRLLESDILDERFKALHLIKKKDSGYHLKPTSESFETINKNEVSWERTFKNLDEFYLTLQKEINSSEKTCNIFVGSVTEINSLMEAMLRDRLVREWLPVNKIFSEKYLLDVYAKNFGSFDYDEPNKYVNLFPEKKFYNQCINYYRRKNGGSIDAETFLVAAITFAKKNNIMDEFKDLNYCTLDEFKFQNFTRFSFVKNKNFLEHMAFDRDREYYQANFPDVVGIHFMIDGNLPKNCFIIFFKKEGSQLNSFLINRKSGKSSKFNVNDTNSVKKCEEIL